MTFKRVVITGAGALTPIGNTLREYWDGLSQGKSGAAPITKFDTTLFKTKFACEVKGFDPTVLMERKEARKLDPFAQYAMAVADEAILDSKLPLDKVNKDRVGVIWGSGIGGLFTFQEEMRTFAAGDGTPRFNPFFIPKMIPDLSAGHISIKYGFHGPNYVTVSACASSTNAIYDAYTYVKLGKADVIVSGGSEAAVCIAGVGGFNALKALSERNDSPETASRPYDKDRDGFVLGEGAGALILEEYEHAKRRGAKIYGEIIGGGMSADAYHITAPHPEGTGIIKVMQYALEEAGIKPEEVDYVNTHGTSTPLGDIGEIKAIQQVFGEHAYQMNISSTKSMTGHLLGAAGAIEAIACLLALEEGIVPPTINHFTDDDELDPRLNLTFNKAQKKNVKVALSNTFGFGGHNASVIIRKVE
ncbi:MAG: beta-ketoacyl-ACP synthase II [Cytophagales bacterium]|nr:beta-ketoacyl-ACP synthase II [Cytophagales bacterium]MCA6367122.1 beta-ketoacyl-ACP synthase II [Cytophagales bacterium]MCA6372975.1 beta-ketoacyl-ACP synthase II [Cytophagales bacterium]MCA6376875.1 beta-ketoacyl-ACP synthase II [Cytophagales bacterium]MCA6385787.1 beta-ketoacyl-ACP synthase II [Cytophagales bacterium]